MIREEPKTTKVVEGEGKEANIFLIKGSYYFKVKQGRVGLSIEFHRDAVDVGLMEIVGFVRLRPPRQVHW
jgi:hypothetical protein